MVETLDYGTFDRAFGRVCGAFRVKLSATDREELTRTYFKVLDAFALDDVLTAGRRVLEKHKKFPAVADWLAELGAAPGAEAPLPFDARQMSAAELDELTHAERLRYFAASCFCSDCEAAGVTDRELRFVPTMVDPDHEERAYHPRRRRLEVTGHWAHGEELARWYVARDAFFARAVRGGQGSVLRRFGFVYRPPAHAPRVVERVPGEEG